MSVRVLHVDDHREFCELVAQFVESNGDEFTVEFATGVDAAVALLEERSYDCVVSDYEMPGRDGLDFLEAVRERCPDLPFILFTGRGSEEIASEAISAGVTDYLQKGGGTDQYEVLTNRIANAVESRRSRRLLDERNRELRLYERMVNSMHEAACIYDEVGRFEVVNDYLAEWYDTSPDALVGRSSPLIDGLRDGESDTYRALLDGERTELSGTRETTFPGHGHAIVEYQFTRLRVDGSANRVVGVARDVTEREARKAALDRTTRAMERAPIGITIADVDGDHPLVYVNQRFLEITGYDEDEVIGRNCRFLQGPETERKTVGAMREAIAADETVRVQVTNYRKDGEAFENEVTISPVRDETGEVVNVVGFQQDLSARTATRGDALASDDVGTETVQ